MRRSVEDGDGEVVVERHRSSACLQVRGPHEPISSRRVAKHPALPCGAGSCSFLFSILHSLFSILSLESILHSLFSTVYTSCYLLGTLLRLTNLPRHCPCTWTCIDLIHGYIDNTWPCILHVYMSPVDVYTLHLHPTSTHQSLHCHPPRPLSPPPVLRVPLHQLVETTYKLDLLRLTCIRIPHKHQLGRYRGLALFISILALHVF